ncbi:PiggyBac transposable element-derived protein 2 [Frankliniella fusca]|uniref:PiggyBac transposable element-derived protein 2 n=1 Tax=Frankliniella fusca TaxID=407009 RepID=A0AAE1HXH6_9NEOP|nr:PiggyBac transposable element-derived protein 2 [Frankliniella fusca]
MRKTRLKATRKSLPTKYNKSNRPQGTSSTASRCTTNEQTTMESDDDSNSSPSSELDSSVDNDDSDTSEIESTEEESLKKTGQVRDRNKKKNEPKDVWIDGDITVKDREPHGDLTDQEEGLSEIEYCEFFFDESILQLITDETNTYSLKRDGISLNLSVAELKIFLALWIYMGICKLPSYHDYWHRDTRVPLVEDNMTRKRFIQIRSRLYFNDTDTESNDPLLWIRPFLDHIISKFKNTGGEFSPELCSLLGFGGRVVSYLCRAIKEPTQAAVSFDNFFTSVPLVVHLKEEFGLLSVGTIRKDRIKGCPLLSDKEFTKLPRGSYDSKVLKDQEIVVVKWKDNKPVTLISSWCGVEPITLVKRWQKADHHYHDVPRPKIVEVYNGHMGGVDVFDMQCELYRPPSRAKRWPIPIFAFLLNLVLVNSYKLFCRDNQYTDQQIKDGNKDFRMKLISYWLPKPVKKRGRPSAADVAAAANTSQQSSKKSPMPPTYIRVSENGHWPVHRSKRGRCRLCHNGYTTFMCEKCKVLLCLNQNRLCFTQFHK